LRVIKEKRRYHPKLAVFSKDMYAIPAADPMICTPQFKNNYFSEM